MDGIKPKHWVFILDDTKPDTFILYAPLHKIILRLPCQIKGQVKEILEGAKPEDFGTVGKIFTSRSLATMPTGRTMSTTVVKGSSNVSTFSLTNRCNLRCTYCYASTGCDFTTMEWVVAKAAIDRLVQVTLKADLDNFSITFHGGGEAFMEYQLLQKCVLYAQKLAKESSLQVKFRAVTNATRITLEIARWLKKHNFSHLTVSMDGIEFVHDAQRPFANGSGSFRAVLAGAYNIQQAGLGFSIRSTVTSISVGTMGKFVKLLAKELFVGGGSVHFEPVTLCGRAKGTISGVDPDEYFDNYLEAKETGKVLGIDVRCTLDGFKKTKKKYCAASDGRMFCLSPNAKVSGCSRVTKDSDLGSDVYFYGDYDPINEVFVLDITKQTAIVEVGTLPAKCTPCCARWTCLGTCPISRYTDPENHEAVCGLTNKLLTYSVQMALSQ